MPFQSKSQKAISYQPFSMYREKEENKLHSRYLLSDTIFPNSSKGTFVQCPDDFP